MCKHSNYKKYITYFILNKNQRVFCFVNFLFGVNLIKNKLITLILKIQHLINNYTNEIL